MLAQMRKATRSWVTIVLILPLVAAFAFFGFGADPLQVFQPQNQVASGKGVAITTPKLLREFDRQLERVQEQSPQQTITRDQAIEASFHTTVLQNLIGEEALEAALDRMGLAASDKAVAKLVREIPAAQNQVTGRFDQELFDRLVRANGFATQAEFLQQLRADLRRNQLSNLAEHPLTAPQAMAKLLFDLQTEQRLISVAQVTENSIEMPGRPSEEALQTFYDQQASARFSLPERRELTVYAARAEDFRADVKVDEAKLRELFDFRKAAKTTPEKRSFVQVSAPTKAAAEDAARRLAAGEEPEAVATAVGGSTVAFADKSKEELFDKAVAEAVFRRGAGETTGAVKGDLDVWVAARLTGITPAATPTFESLREELQQELETEEAARLASEAAAQFEDLLDKGEPLESAAQQAGVKVIDLPALTKEGRSVDTGETLWPAGALLDEAFTLPSGEVTQFETIDGGSALARVDVIVPGGPVPLAQVRDAVEQQYMATEIQKRARAAAEAIRAQAQASGDLAAAARAAKANVLFSERPVTRAFFQQAPDPQIVGDVFAAKEGDVVVTFGGAWVVRVDKVVKQSPEEAPEAFAQAKTQVRQQLLEDLVYGLRARAVDEADTKINQNLLAQLFKPSSAAP